VRIAIAESQHAVVAAFSARLAVRPDTKRVRGILANEFAEHARSLWPARDESVTPAWISAHTDEILAVLERLYAQAVLNPTSGAVEFLDRFATTLVDLPRSATPRRLTTALVTPYQGGWFRLFRKATRAHSVFCRAPGVASCS